MSEEEKKEEVKPTKPQEAAAEKKPEAKAEAKTETKAEAKPTEEASKKKSRKVSRMTLPEIEAKLKIAKEKMGGFQSHFAQDLLARKKELSEK